MDLPNGLHVSIITDGYGSEKGLYEAMVWDDDNVNITGLVTGGDDVYGWLDEVKLGLLIARAAKLQKRWS
jgi:hypothetical protein